jgi:hypothetical protein
MALAPERWSSGAVQALSGAIQTPAPWSISDKADTNLSTPPASMPRFRSGSHVGNLHALALQFLYVGPPPRTPASMPAPEPGEQRIWPLLCTGAPGAGVATAYDLHILLRHDFPPCIKCYLSIHSILKTSDLMPSAQAAVHQKRRTALTRKATPTRISTSGQNVFTLATPPRPTISRNPDHR